MSAFRKTIQVEATYENGVFRPLQPVDLPDGSRVEVIYRIEAPPPDPQRIERALEAIAAMPREGPDDGFSGADHDEVLYPKIGDSTRPEVWVARPRDSDSRE
jgi:predicted DNA-binding antitoxin AbrB/MazE fold protein